jgi:hypothetical protein
MKQRRTRRQRRLSRKKGGANNNANGNAPRNTNAPAPAPAQPPRVNCDGEGFTHYMKEATTGSQYRNPVWHIHIDGERWSYDTLVDFTMNGRIIDWYIKQFQNQGIVFTPEDIERIKSMEELKILGAFFHRYKVVAERLRSAIDNLEKGVARFVPKYSTYTTTDSYDQFLRKPNLKISPSMIPKFKLLRDFVQNNTTGKNRFIELAIDRAQCLMFLIVKRKGVLPPGFVMDERIRTRAETPIHVDMSDRFNTVLRIEPTINWLQFLERDSAELSNPEVKFGVFETMFED